MKLSLSAREKLDVLYNLYEQPMYRVAYAILHNKCQAEDAVSDAFIKIAENLDKIKNPDSEKTRCYIIKIIKNESINQYRRNQRESERFVSTESIADIEDNQMESAMEQAELEDMLDGVLLKIPEKYRKIMIMRCVYEMSFQEIAEELNEKASTVRKQYERAKKMLLKAFGDSV